MAGNDYERLFKIMVDQQADVEALRFALQCLVVTLLAGFAKREEMFLDWRSGTIERASKEIADASTEDRRRLAQLVYQATEALFDEIAPAFGQDPVGKPSS
jgi:hypothetical protein